MPIVWKQAPILVVAMLTTVFFLMSACGGDDEKGGGSTSGEGVTPAVEGDTTGVTGTSIKIGALLPMSNNSAAAWGIPLSQGMKAYFDYINDQGGIYGRKIELIVGDNQYTGAAASEAARRLVERDKVFAFQGAVGTAAHSAAYKYLEENGVPDMFLLTGNTMFTEPIVKTRFGLLVDYITEGRILAKYVSDNYAGKKLGIIVQNDDAGKEAERGVRQGLEEYGAGMEVVVEYYDETQSDMTVSTQRLQNEEVDIILILGGPVQVGSTLKAARETLDWEVPMAISSVNAVEIVARLAGFDNIEGVVSVTIGHQAFEEDVPGVARFREIMARYAPDAPADNLTLSGYSVSEAMVNVLKQAGTDLTRESFLAAAESVCEYMCSTCLAPSSMQPDDHRAVEVGIFVRATVDRSTDPPAFTWEPFGEPFGFESTSDCAKPTPPPDYDNQPTTLGD